ncbi:hypothetical protein [Undibacterium sp.]|uniref:hypothetical protein n=1 Tax=Undibacterium sp. TaxID=1914977 RepID=UPI0037503C03
MTSRLLTYHPDYSGKRVLMPTEIPPLYACGGIQAPYVIDGPLSVDIDAQLRDLYATGPESLDQVDAVHGRIVFEGQRLSMVDREPELKAHPRIVRLSDAEMSASANGYPLSGWSSYEGCWVVKNDRLFLTGIRGVYKLIGDEPLFAHWYSGTLRMPTGPLVEYSVMTKLARFASEHYAEFQAGIVVNTWDQDDEWARPLPAERAWKS